MKQRSFFFDNAKFILIFFVVFGHLLRSFINDSEVILAIYKTIYAFHMPAFVLISGFFAKGIFNKAYIIQLAKKLILPYFIFQGAYSLYYYYLDAEPAIILDPFEPHWSLWFLVSLFFWNIMIVIFVKQKKVIGMAIAISVGLLVGYLDEISNFLSLSRTFVFFPMFLLGYYLDLSQLNKLFSFKVRIGALFIFTIVFIGFYLYPDFNHEWLLGSKPYSELISLPLTAMFTRLGYYILSFIVIISFLSLVPRGQYFFTVLGRRTLYVYLLHGFFIQFFRQYHLADYFTDMENYLLLVGIALLLTFTLSSQFVCSLAQPFIELGTSRFSMLLIRLKALIAFFFIKKNDPIN
ncbi:MAG: acyltransferase family protein [Bacillus sp. (in: firmicutes)]